MLAVAFAAAAFFVVVLAALLGSRVTGAANTKLIDDFGQLVASAVAAGCCLVIALRAAGLRRAAWALIGAYAGIWAGSELVWLLFDLSSDTQKPFPSIAAIGFVAAVPLAVAGSLAFGLRGGAHLSAVVRALDAVTVGVALMLICWFPVLERVFQTNEFGVGSELMSLSIPIGDILVVTFLWSAIASSAFRLRPSLVVVAVGFVSISIADLYLAYASANGNYASGTLFDLFWTAGFLVLGAGAALETGAMPSVSARSRSIGPRRLAIWVPFSCTMLALGVAVIDYKGDRVIDPVTVTGVLVIVVLASVRQVIEAMANRRLISRLGMRARTDSLTGLANRETFRLELERAMSADRLGSGVLYIDIDNFKSVNDRFGHAAGDRVLTVVAGRFVGALRPTNSVARVGGDEFAILCRSATTRDEIAEIARRVQECFQEPVAFGADEIAISGTVGAAAMAPEDDAEAALRQADVALYAAKERGRGSIEIYDDVIHGGALSRMWLEADMADSLERGDFTLLYQPTVRSATSKIGGAEALIRWDHPVRGRISPLDFIPVAEASGFIVELGSWILHRALHDAASWRKDGSTATVSVNVTVQQLRSAGFVDDVSRALEELKMAARDLILELTESAYVQDSASIASVIHALRQRGIRIAIDDFGTGYSSLALLTKLDADILKIDRSFVVNASTPAGRLVLKTVIDLARTLRLSTTVEGVETAEEALLVRALGADTIQGYHYDRPLTLEVFRRRVDPFATLVAIEPPKIELLGASA